MRLRHSQIVVCLAALTTLAGCGADIAVRVWGPSQRPLSDVHVALAGLSDPRCLEDWMAWDVTDGSGLARMHLAACKEYRLVVSGKGLRTRRQLIDTCQVHFLNVSVEAARLTDSSTRDCAPAAQRFIRAWLRRDHAQLQAMLVDLDRSIVDDALVTYLKPWAIDVQSKVSQDVCHATVGLFLQSGCESRWHIEFRSHGAEWRVWKMEPLSAHDITN
jgi:hypothetical protein